tara:strand:+ start:518 stop:865 length:348 start_codon:yes stop_codon:yes gene_type:complete
MEPTKLPNHIAPVPRTTAVEPIKEHVKNAIDFIHSNAVKYGGSIQFVELESETNIVKIRIKMDQYCLDKIANGIYGGRSWYGDEVGDMTCEKLFELVKGHLMSENPDCRGVVQVL